MHPDRQESIRYDSKFKGHLRRVMGNVRPLTLSYMTAKLTAQVNNDTASKPKFDISMSRNGSINEPVDFNTGLPLEPLVVDLDKHLADEDRKAGK